MQHARAGLRGAAPAPLAHLRAVRWVAQLLRPRPRADERPRTEIQIRFATAADRVTWPELETTAPEKVLVADFNGSPHAALSLVDGAVLAVAEPARALALIDLLELHAEELDSDSAADTHVSQPARRFRRI